MNAAAASSPTDLMEAVTDNTDNNSDSDVDSNETMLDNYQPITMNAEDSDEDPGEASLSDHHIIDSSGSGQHRLLPNGHIHHQFIVNGTRSLHLSNDSDDHNEEEEEREKEEEDERRRAESEIRRAFQADESRRAAPLTRDNTARVREAMRGVSFAGVEPEWARAVPEDQWIDRLRSLRQSPSTASSRSAA